MKKILTTIFILLNLTLFCQTISIKDTLVKFLINKHELEIFNGETINYYYDAIHLIPISECEENKIGIYRFGVNTDHGDEYVVIINGSQINILTGIIGKDIEILLDFFTRFTYFYDNKKIVFCLRKIIEINKRNNEEKVYQIKIDCEKK